MIRLTLFFALSLCAAQAGAQTCWNTIAPDIWGGYSCQQCATAECGAGGKGDVLVDEYSAAIPIFMGDLPRGDAWNLFVEESPEHALWFLGMRDLAEQGRTFDARDSHVANMFRATPRMVEMIRNGKSESPEALLKAADPLLSNQIIRVEARGRRVDSSTIGLLLTTVLQTAHSKTEFVTEVLSERSYELAVVRGSNPNRLDAENETLSAEEEESRTYGLVAIDGRPVR